MSDRVISATEDTPLSELANILEKNRIKRVPILKDGKLAEIVSRANLIQALASAPPSPPRIPSLIAASVRPSWRGSQISPGLILGSATSWSPMGSCIFGGCRSPEEHKALLAVAEGIPGVRQISDEMIASYSVVPG